MWADDSAFILHFEPRHSAAEGEVADLTLLSNQLSPHR
jgi:hypothetical protein